MWFLYQLFHFLIPVIQDIKVVDVKVHTINYKGFKDKPDKEEYALLVK